MLNETSVRSRQSIHGSAAWQVTHPRELLSTGGIRAEKELDRASKRTDALISRGDLCPAEEDYLEVLGDLVERYETEHHPIPAVSDAAMLRHLLEAREVSQSALARATGIVNSTLFEVLRRKRKLTRGQIGKLASYFHVEPGVFAFEGNQN